MQCVPGHVCACTHVFPEVEKTWKDILTGCPQWIDEWLGHVFAAVFSSIREPGCSVGSGGQWAQRRPEQPLTCATLLTARLSFPVPVGSLLRA